MYLGMCTYMCGWTSFLQFSSHQQPHGAPKSTQFTSKYQVLEPQGPQQSPGGSRLPQKGFLLQLLTHIGPRFGIDLCPETFFFLMSTNLVKGLYTMTANSKK